MNKKYLYILLIPAMFLLQNCKKDKTTTTDTPTYTLQAYIGGTLWNPDTLSSSITYNATAKTRVFSFTGTQSQKRITASVKDFSPANSNDFTIGTYNVNTTGDAEIKYYLQVKNSSGAYVFKQYGIVEAGSGSVIITSIDVANKTITGTYTFTSKQINYDDHGNIVSVDIANVAAGAFNALPYTFTSK